MERANVIIKAAKLVLEWSYLKQNIMIIKKVVFNAELAVINAILTYLVVNHV